MNDESVQIDAVTYGDAVREAAEKLRIPPRELAVEVLDPGSSANSLTGYRPVKIRAWRRDPNASPDGARVASASPRQRGGDEGSYRGGRGGVRRPAGDYGPPPPPLDPSLITPALVETIREVAAGIVDAMGFAATATADRTKEGVRVAIQAGEKDQFLIGRDGETLDALQHLVARMLRARMPDAAAPRVEIDVAGYRDRRVKSLRELALELVEQVKETGEEAMTDPLSAIERRVVHLEVAELPGFESVSIGDGLFKRVIIRPTDVADDRSAPRR
jgi:spoIIIJ-associated protein